MAVRPKKNPITKIVGAGIKAITKSTKAAPKPKPKMSKEKKNAIGYTAGFAGTVGMIGEAALDKGSRKHWKWEQEQKRKREAKAKTYGKNNAPKYIPATSTTVKAAKKKVK